VAELSPLTIALGGAAVVGVGLYLVSRARAKPSSSLSGSGSTDLFSQVASPPFPPGTPSTAITPGPALVVDPFGVVLYSAPNLNAATSRVVQPGRYVTITDVASWDGWVPVRSVEGEGYVCNDCSRIGNTPGTPVLSQQVPPTG
jgi:hypothetical protein